MKRGDYRYSSGAVEIHPEEISPWEMQQLVSPLLSLVKKFYSDPENVRKFEEWQAKRKETTTND